TTTGGVHIATMTGYRQQKPKIGLTKCPDLVDHYISMLDHRLVAPCWMLDVRGISTRSGFIPNIQPYMAK
ncbi:hypothetical protein, partial [Aeromonas hydrophila]